MASAASHSHCGGSPQAMSSVACFGSGREVEARTTNVPKLPNGFQLCKQYIQAHVLGCQEVRNDLEYHGFQVRQAREPRPAQLHQRVRYQPGMGIEPVPVDGIATGEMDLPDTFQERKSTSLNPSH